MKLLEAATTLSDSMTADSIPTKDYVQVYKVICAFLRELGKVMGFVVSEIEGKLKILEGHIAQNEESHKFVNGIVKFEVDNNITITKGGKNSSASRTLLRLHRALHYIATLIKGMYHAPEKDSSTTIASSAYADTLAHHHGFFIRKGVQASFYALTSREKIQEAFAPYAVAADNVKNQAAVKEAADSICEIFENIHGLVEKLFGDYNLLQLP